MKDSFCALDLAPFGFRTLFEAQWICRSTLQPRLEGPEEGMAEVRWARIESAADLTDWEAAWSGEPHTHEARIFLPALLTDENVVVIVGYHHQRMVAGAIANRAADVVGLSNLFAPARECRPLPGRMRHSGDRRVPRPAGCRLCERTGARCVTGSGLRNAGTAESLGPDDAMSTRQRFGADCGFSANGRCACCCRHSSLRRCVVAILLWVGRIVCRPSVRSRDHAAGRI